MVSKWVSEEAWLSAIGTKRVAIQRYAQPGYYIPYHGPNPEVVEAEHQKGLRHLRASLKRIMAAGEYEWQERLNAQGS